MTALSNPQIVVLIGDGFAACAILGCLYLSLAAIMVLRFPREESFEEIAAPVTVLKPLHGAEPGLLRRVRSCCMQNYRGEVQVVCGVRDVADPAAGQIAPIVGAQAFEIELIVNAAEHGRNRKVSNLANMLPSARHDILVIADSDIEVEPDYLARVVSQLHRPNVGAVTCLYHGVAAKEGWSEYAALAINGHFLPSAIFAVSFGLAQPCFGSTIALRKSVLRGFGGFEAFADRLADDYAIGAAVRSAGKEVSVGAFTVGHMCSIDSFRGLLSQEMRVARTIRSLDPIGYAGTFITHPFALALLSLVLGCEFGDLLAVLALACRAALCFAVGYAFRLRPQPYWIIPFRDALSFAIYAVSFFGEIVTWRGFDYRVNAEGKPAPHRAASQRKA
ncbi:bacteriohopanetetrol glucosamine biosynthesis glycosyltransferase HpnI [Methylocystis heyeri]|uniref:bacteriohopanetetrol glucosamine biosynthesis glycosyltransferase HpnI n=1 Tax=Methylocystis heyeri TaxID=391905 RepID=UPI001134EE75|nr:bacteriohopanetetrol glucosamine biosynthesis glycosyltransferase HpnI [Methylocystis heyeri]